MGKGCRSSNFYQCRVEIYGKVFASSEMSYQWQKAFLMGEEGLLNRS